MKAVSIRLAALLGALTLSAAAPQAQERLTSTNVVRAHAGVQVGIRLPQFGRRPYNPRPAYCPPQRVQRVWVPGCWVTETQRNWIPARTEQVFVEAVYETRYDSCGNPYQVLVCAAHYQTVTHPGYWDECQVRVWRPGHWQTVRR